MNKSLKIAFTLLSIITVNLLFAQSKNIELMRDGSITEVKEWYTKNAKKPFISAEVTDFCEAEKQIHVFVFVCFFGRLDVADALLEQVQAEEKSQAILDMALASAVHTGNEKLMSLLQANGASSGGVCELCYDRNDLLIAAAYNREEYFNANFNDVSAKEVDCMGNTVLHLAAASNGKAILEKSLSANVHEIDVLNKVNSTPFMIALNEGKLETAQYLHSKGASTSLIDADGVNAMSMAIAGGNEELKQWAKEKTGQWNSVELMSADDVQELNINTHSVYFSEDGWSKLMDDFFYNYPFINDIEIDGTSGSNIPYSLDGLSFLTSFKASGAGFKDISALAGLQNLKTIMIYDCKVSMFPLTPSENKSLEKLELMSTEIDQIPDEINNFKALKSLDLNNSKIKKFPESMSGLESLTYLNLTDCGLTEIPDALKTLKNIETLDLSENDIKESAIEKLQEELPNCEIIY